jgi:type IV pilus assembly protein PilM
MNNTYFYQDKPVFGLDIGHNSIKVMQIEASAAQKQVVSGYGITSFDPTAIKDGTIVDVETIAKSAYNLFAHNLVGDITSRRANVAIPAARTFTRSVTLPKLSPKDLSEAVRLEAEQYIPVPVDDLYMDFTPIRQTAKDQELLVVAVPRKIIDSYIDLLKVLGIEAVSIETTIGADSRLFLQAEQSDVPTVLIDLGSLSADVTIYDGGLVVTGTVQAGGDSFTDAIASGLHVSKQEAHIIKTKYGLSVSKKQREIGEALAPVLEQMLREIRRMIRYYEERSGTSRKISQVITVGGGANMPGLSEYLTSHLRLAVRMCDPWQHLDFKGLQPPSRIEKSMYITVAGLALVRPKEIFV